MMIRKGQPCIQLNWSDEDDWKDYAPLRGDNQQQLRALQSQGIRVPGSNGVTANFRIGPANDDGFGYV